VQDTAVATHEVQRDPAALEKFGKVRLGRCEFTQSVLSRTRFLQPEELQTSTIALGSFQGWKIGSGHEAFNKLKVRLDKTPNGAVGSAASWTSVGMGKPCEARHGSFDAPDGFRGGAVLLLGA
jgi:hypothetical protein